MNENRARSIDLRPEVMRAYNLQLRRDLERTAWAATEKSW